MKKKRKLSRKRLSRSRGASVKRSRRKRSEARAIKMRPRIERRSSRTMKRKRATLKSATAGRGVSPTVPTRATSSKPTKKRPTLGKLGANPNLDAVAIYREGMRRLGEKTRKAKARQALKLKSIVDVWLDKVYVSQEGKEKLTAEERRFLQSRVSQKGIAAKVARESLKSVYRKVHQGPHKGLYRVLKGPQKGRWVKESIVRRSVLMNTYWRQVRALAEVMDLDIKTARRVLKVAKESNTPDIEALFGIGGS